MSVTVKDPNAEKRAEAIQAARIFAEENGHDGELTLYEEVRHGEIGFLFSANGKLGWVGYAPQHT